MAHHREAAFVKDGFQLAQDLRQQRSDQHSDFIQQIHSQQNMESIIQNGEQLVAVIKQLWPNQCYPFMMTYVPHLLQELIEDPKYREEIWALLPQNDRYKLLNTYLMNMDLIAILKMVGQHQSYNFMATLGKEWVKTKLKQGYEFVQVLQYLPEPHRLLFINLLGCDIQDLLFCPQEFCWVLQNLPEVSWPVLFSIFIDKFKIESEDNWGFSVFTQLKEVQKPLFIAILYAMNKEVLINSHEPAMRPFISKMQKFDSLVQEQARSTGEPQKFQTMACLLLKQVKKEDASPASKRFFSSSRGGQASLAETLCEQLTKRWQEYTAEECYQAMEVFIRQNRYDDLKAGTFKGILVYLLVMAYPPKVQNLTLYPSL